MSPSHRPPPWAFAVGLGATVLAATPASAQDEGEPRILTPRAELEGLQLRDFDAALELEWRRDVDDRDPPTGPGQRDKEDRLREILELRTSGFIGHPNLIELDLGGRVWLEQRWLDVGGGDQRSDQTLFEWDASALMLKETRLPITVYTRQNVSDIDRAFGGSLENTFRETGVRLDLRHETLPTHFQAFRREIEQEDRLLRDRFEIDQDTVQADGRVELGANHQLAWDVRYDDVDEAGNLRLTRSVERLETNATHTIRFGERGKNVLRTRMRYFDETGDRNLRQLRIDPRLRLRHTDTFHTWYDYSYGRDDRIDQEQRTQRISGNFQHDLFQSLTTIGSAGFERFELPMETFTSDEAFGRLDTEYRKIVPGGRLTIGLDGSFVRQDQSDRGAPIAVTDDLFVFDAFDRIVIRRRNVDPLTIVLTDVAGFIVFTEGVDYLVRMLADRIEIDRLAGGFIAPGQAVLVDYVVGPEPGGRTDTVGAGVDFRYTFTEGVFDGLSLYLQYRHQEESRDVRDPDFLENDFDDTRYGVEYTRGKAYLRAEYQERRGALSPFDAVRFEGRWVEPLGRGSNLVLSGIFQEVDRSLEDLRTTTTTLTGRWNHRLDARWRVALIVRQQWSDDSRGFESRAFEQQLDVSWRRGRTELYAQVRNVLRDTNADDTTLQRFIVGVRREF